MPERIEVGARPAHGTRADGGGRGRVVAVEPLGPETHLVVRAGEIDLRASARGMHAYRRGDEVLVSIDAGRAMIFDAEGDGARVS